MSSATPQPAADVAALRVAALTKTFGATVALDGADLTVRPGTVHALIGGNGCGKSTTIKVLAGVHRADSGTLEVAGTTWSAADYDARAGRAAGLRFVHQDLGMFPELSVAENVALDAGYPRAAGGRIGWSALHDRVATLLERYEIDVSPRTPVAALRPAQRSMVAIARALQDGDDAERPLILILDEPTASLPHHESRLLLDSVRRRADTGQTVVIVSHRMPEILSVADDITVFRDGRTVATLVDARPTERELVSLMTGRQAERAVADVVAAEPATAAADGDPADVALEVTDLVGGPLQGVSLRLRRGEVVGIAGLVGSGRTTLLKTVFGEHQQVSGTVRIGATGLGPERGASTPGRMAEGVAYVPEDRGGEAAFADLTVRENLTATVTRTYWRPWGMARGRERSDARQLLRTHAVKAASSEVSLSALSGGNQQKAVLARWLRREPSVLLLDEPTQGVDVMSRVDIYHTVRAAAERGCAVLVASSDLIELCTLCDRVVVLQEGRLTAEVSGPDLTADHLTELTQSSGSTTAAADAGANR